jgi:hypothetical protein
MSHSLCENYSSPVAVYEGLFKTLLVWIVIHGMYNILRRLIRLIKYSFCKRKLQNHGQYSEAFVIDNILMFLTNSEVYMVNTRTELCIHRPFSNLNCVDKRSLLTIQDPNAN